MTTMRLQRLLARAGVTSRRKAEALVREGRVRVNGRPGTLGESVDPAFQHVTLDGKPVQPAAVVWLALHKPADTAVTRGDPEGRRTVFELLPPIPGLTYVGRLDIPTTGLLLLTTDGKVAHRLTHPRYRVPRTYQALVRGLPAAVIRRRLARPVMVGGRAVMLERLAVRNRGHGVELTVTLREGRHRIVRKLCRTVGLRVERLHRISYGPVELGALRPGQYRELTAGERRALERRWNCETRRR